MPIPTFGPKAGQWISNEESKSYYLQYGQGVPFSSAYQAGTPEQEAQDAAMREAQQYAEAGLPAPQVDFNQRVAEESARREQERVNAEAQRNKVPLSTEQLYNQAIQQRVSPWESFYESQAAQSNLNLPGMQLANQNQAATEQARVIQALQAQAAGSKDTLGQQQLQRGFNQAASQQRSLGSSIRGAGGGAGLRAGAMGAADTQRGFAGQSEMLKLQEQQAAQAMLAQLLAQQHTQDVGLAGAMASGSLTNQQLNQDMERFYQQQRLGQYLNNYQYGADLSRAQLGFDLGARNLAQQQRDQAMGAIASGIGTIGSMAKDREKADNSSPNEVSYA